MIPARDCFEPVALSAPGAKLRAAVFAGSAVADPRGICVLLNGQTEFIEKYFEVIDELRGRGLTVVALDWRGQGGSGRLVPGAPLKGYINDFAEYDADLEVLMGQVVEPLLTAGKRPIALAHSMGGHILLRYLHRHPQGFAACAFCAPMLMFSTRGQPRWLVRLVTDVMTRTGHGTDFVWGIAGRDPLTMTFGEQIVTSDPHRFQRTQDFLARHPQLRLAGPTWGWVAAAWRSIAGFADRHYAENIATPALICGAGHDRICVTEEARRFARRMPRCTYLEIDGAEHEILMERDVFRQRFWNAFDAFIKAQI
jgi:lysophospholipase